MPSREHQWLLLWTARKMEQDGFEIRGYEGPTPQGGIRNNLHAPFPIGDVRPDVWGVTHDGLRLAVGEAKSAEDVDTPHTVKQLSVFGRLRFRPTPEMARLYVAVPRSAGGALGRVLIRAGLSEADNVVRILIPDSMLERGGYER